MIMDFQMVNAKVVKIATVSTVQETHIFVTSAQMAMVQLQSMKKKFNVQIVTEIAQNAEIITKFVPPVLIILVSKMESAYLAHQIVKDAKKMPQNVISVNAMMAMVPF